LSNAIAVSIVPGELRLLVAGGNGDMKPLHRLARELPPGAVRAGLRSPNVVDPAAVGGVLEELAGFLGDEPLIDDRSLIVIGRQAASGCVSPTLNGA